VRSDFVRGIIFVGKREIVISLLETGSFQLLGK
jgi:hypothetical protein